MVDGRELRLVVDRELTLLRPEVRANREELEALLADDFVEIGASGRVWNRAELIAELLAAPALDDVVVADVHAHAVAPGVVVVIYATSRAGVQSRRTGWWRKSATGWRCFFHQGTRIASPVVERVRGGSGELSTNLDSPH